ncbi:MAG TPA: hypothetical protein VFL84_12845 [Gammaproteobacteria bacterium]|nr:hypothetical protein [Gammaproteobacteria bacterium]
MNTDELFRQLEPPPGGAEAFARRLDEIAAERPSRRARVLAAAAAVAAVALVTAIVLTRKPSDAPPVLVADDAPAVDIYNAPELDRLLGRPSRPAELMVMVNMETANVTKIETSNEKVRIYQIN